MYSTKEPAPVINQSRPVVDLLVEDIRERSDFGLKKYGTRLQANNGRDALIDLFQEQLDGAMYARQLIEEMKCLSKNLNSLYVLIAGEQSKENTAEAVDLLISIFEKNAVLTAETPLLQILESRLGAQNVENFVASAED